MNKHKERLLSLKPGDIIYEKEYQMGSIDYFEHEVVSIDIENDCVNTLDKSQTFYYKEGKPRTLYSFYLLKEINPQKYRDKRINDILSEQKDTPKIIHVKN